MAYQRVRQPKISDVIMQQLETMILEGTFRPGQRLPPERELASQFGVSRPSLREAVQKLSARGLLTSRQGGGTFVSKDLGGSLSDPLLELFRTHPESRYDLLEFRHALEGISAYYAALRSTAADRVEIQARFDELQQCHEARAFDREVAADVEFHLAIAAAAHNVVLLHMMRALFDLLRQHIWDNLEQIYPRHDMRSRIHEQHHRLLQAVLTGDPVGARQAAHDHLACVEEVLLKQGQEQTRLERALRRANMNHGDVG